MLVQYYSSPPAEIISEIYSPTFKRFLKCRWDTGAPRTYLKVNQFFTKPSKGMTSLNTKDGMLMANIYNVKFTLDPLEQPIELDVLGVSKLRDVDCVIGMDIICRGDFNITMTRGMVFFTFKL